MRESTLRPTPRPGDVLLEQIRVTAVALRWPAALLLALLVPGTAVVLARIAGAATPVPFHPEQLPLPALIGLLLPIALWRGEGHFGAGFLWTLPVDRRWHALARVAAGWVWLVAAVAVLVLWQLSLALASGTTVLAAETVRFVPAYLPGVGAPLEPGGWQTIARAPEPLLWLAPFTAATAAYLLASALALGTRYPLRWLVGAVLAFFVLRTTGEVANVQGFVDRASDTLLLGPYGLDMLLTARTTFLKVGTTLANGEPVVVWRGFPDPADWATATLLWTGLALAAVWAAASRHRERRRS